MKRFSGAAIEVPAPAVCFSGAENRVSALAIPLLGRGIHFGEAATRVPSRRTRFTAGRDGSFGRAVEDGPAAMGVARSPAMGESVFHKLFGAGKEPEAITHALAGEPRIFSCEGISVTVHKSGHVPGAMAHGKVGAHVGGFVVTPRRLLGYMAGGKVLDVPWDFPPGQVVHAWLDPTGLHARWDIPRANPEWKGEMTIHFKQDIAPQQLAAFPRTEVWFDVAPQNVAAFFRGRG